jgi:SAM-dependent methyltransferase
MAYREDVAYIHDAGFGHFARAAAPFLIDQLGRRGLKQGRVIELGCGTGILAAELVQAGYDVLGVDQSEAMLHLARQRVPGTEFRRGSFLNVHLPSCIAVCAIGEIFNFLFDDANTKAGLFRVFRQVHEALRPGGIFVFDMAGPGRVPGPGPQRNYREGDDWAVLFTAEEDRRRRLVTREITSFRKVGELYRRDHEVHRLRLYSRSEIAGALRRCGFRVRGLCRYGAFAFPPGLFGFLARKA